MVAALLTLTSRPATAAESQLDPTYGDAGIATFVDLLPDEGDEDQGILSVADTVDHLGRALALSWLTENELMRMTVDGQADLTFGDGGVRKMPEDFHPRQLVATEDGIALGGIAYEPGTYLEHPAVVRLLPNGDFDDRFGVNGLLVLPRDPAMPWAQVLSLDLTAAGGLIFAVGEDHEEPEGGWVHAYRADGTSDPTFGQAGVLAMPAPSGVPVTIEIDAQGRIVVASYLETSGRLLRLLPNGAPDPSFGSGGAVTLPGGMAVAVDVAERDGSILAGGYLREGGGPAIWKLNATGAFDRTFGTDGRARAVPEGHMVWSVEALPSGHVVASTDAGAKRLVSILRPDGTMETTFDGDGVVESAHEFPWDGLGVGPGGRVLVTSTESIDLSPANDQYLTQVRAYLPDLPAVSPEITSVTAGRQSLSVRWDPAETGTKPVKAYQVVALDDGALAAQHVVAGDVRQTSLTGLTNGEEYDVVVVPLTVDGAGLASALFEGAPSAAAPAATVASAVQGLTISNGRRFATVTWAPPTNDGGAPILGYGVIAIRPGNATVAGWRNVPADVRTASMPDLLPGVLYDLYVLPYTALGYGDLAPAVHALLVDSPAPLPAPPTVPWAAAHQVGSNAYVSWGAGVEHGEVLAGFHVIVVRDGQLIGWQAVAPEHRQVAVSVGTTGTVDVYVLASSAGNFGPLGNPIHVR